MDRVRLAPETEKGPMSTREMIGGHIPHVWRYDGARPGAM